MKFEACKEPDPERTVMKTLPLMFKHRHIKTHRLVCCNCVNARLTGFKIN